MHSRFPKVATAVGVTIALSVVTSAALGLVNDTASRIIVACVSESGGNARIVQSESDCRRNERVESWSEQGPPGPAGAPGAPGATGEPGPRGVDGIVDLTYVTGEGVLAGSRPGPFTNATAFCPAGMKVLAGGFEVLSPKSTPMIMRSSLPLDDAGWIVTGHNFETAPGTTLRATAVCALVAGDTSP